MLRSDLVRIWSDVLVLVLVPRPCSWGDEESRVSAKPQEPPGGRVGLSGALAWAVPPQNL
jgi:hypothetical protein